jgi:hypothetical protein
MNVRFSFGPAPGIRYAVESASIKLIAIESGTTHSLGYPEAAVWDMAARGYDAARIVDYLTDIACVTPAQAERIVADLFARLHELGFVARTKIDD